MRPSPWLVASLFLLTAARAGAAPWDLPEPGDCAAARAPGADEAGAAAAFPFAPGKVVDVGELDALGRFLPPEVVEARDALFFPGMRLEIGPCFRSYAPPAFFREATERFAGRARLTDGGLEDAPAGLPFPPEAIAADDPEAGQKWAWNAARRYRAAGSFGSVRFTYLRRGKLSSALVGDAFLAILLGRADLATGGYKLPWARKERWVAGGRVRDPSTGGSCSFRHFRGAEAAREGSGDDDVFFRSSQMRKPERVGWDPEFPLVTCAFARGYYLPRGGRPERYRWRVAGVRDLLAPINATTPAYPESEERGFGASGGSLASDRWDLRRVLVLESREPGPTIRRYLDLETLFPLYHVEEWDGRRILIQNAGRWSEDRADYPRWTGDPERPVRVIDLAVSVLRNGDETTRTETWDAVAIPPERPPLRRLVSAGALERK